MVMKISIGVMTLLAICICMCAGAFAEGTVSGGTTEPYKYRLIGEVPPIGGDVPLIGEQTAYPYPDKTKEKKAVVIQYGHGEPLAMPVDAEHAQ